MIRTVNALIKNGKLNKSKAASGIAKVFQRDKSTQETANKLMRDIGYDLTSGQVKALPESGQAAPSPKPMFKS
jgi:hypothetical protein